MVASGWSLGLGGMLISTVSKAALVLETRVSLEALPRGGRPFLNSTDQLVGFAITKARFVPHQAGQRLLQLAFGNVPISFGDGGIHIKPG
jgi:hypothetical protein